MRYPWLYVGAKVVCVEALKPYHGEAVPRVGETYTVSDVIPCADNEVRLRVAEVQNPAFHYRWAGYGPGAFLAYKFRPVLPDATHIIEQLKAALPKRGRVDA